MHGCNAVEPMIEGEVLSALGIDTVRRRSRSIDSPPGISWDLPCYLEFNRLALLRVDLELTAR
jgi:hypothetical protein